MAVPIAELFITVGADVAGAVSSLNQLNQQLSRVQTNAANATRGFSTGNLGRSIASLGNQTQTVGRDLTAGLTAPIIGIGLAAFKAGTDFEHSFTQVRRTVDGLDDTQLQQLRTDLIEMSKTPAGGLKTASELADIAAVGGQLGLTGNEIKAFTSLVARLSLATDLPFGEIADDVGRSLKVMNLGEKDYERFGSAVAALGNEMGGTERDIFEFSKRLAATLSSVGVAPDQILAISAALSEVGINPEAGATAINKFFVDMVNSLNDTSGASEETKQKLQNLKDTIADLSGNLEVAQLRQKEFGRNTPASVVKANQIAIDKYQREIGQANDKLNNFSGTSADAKLNIAGMANVAGVSEDAFRQMVKTDPARAFAAFVAGLQNIRKTGGPAAVTKTLEELGLTEERQREALLALSTSEHSLDKALDVANKGWNEQTALQNEVGKAMQDPINQMELAANTIQADLIAAFDKQRETVDKLLQSMNNLLPSLQKIADAIPTFSPEQLAGFALLAALGPALFGIGSVLAGIGAVVASPGILVFIGALVGIPLLINEIANDWDNFKTILAQVPFLGGLVGIIDFFKQHGDEIKTVLAGIISAVATWGTNLSLQLSAILIGAGKIFSAFGTFLDNFFNSIVLPILERFKGWIREHILGALIGVLQFLQTAGVTTLPGGTNVSDLITQLQTQQAESAAAAGGNTATVTINNPQVTSQDLLDRLGQQVGEAVTNALITAQNSVVVITPNNAPLPGVVPGTPF